MIEKLRLHWPFAAVALLLAIWVLIVMRGCSAQRQVARDVVQAQAQHEQAVIHAAQGASHDQEAQTLQAKIAADAQLVAQLRRQLARQNAAPVPVPPAPGAPDPQPVVAPDSPVPDSRDALIQAQDQQIQDQAAEITTLTLSRDSWHAAYDSEAMASTARRLAMDAQMAAMKAERWKGRFEGLAVGLGAGFVAGKVW